MPDYPDSVSGEVYCEHKGDRVGIGGAGKIYVPGTIVL